MTKTGGTMTTNTRGSYIEEELKPCPFCGGEKLDFFKGEFVDSTHSIECMNCWAIVSKSGEKEAIKAWNRRVV